MSGLTHPRTSRSPRAGLVLLVTSLGVLIAQIDTSVVSLAVKRIGEDLGSNVSEMQWVIDAYNLVYATLLLTGGTLGDLYGRRRIFTLGIVLFAVGTIVCAIAPSGFVLIAGRAISGLGAALELPMSLVLLTLAYPETKARQHALGIWASCNGLAFIIGPTAGGFFVDIFGWRSIFYLVLPVCAVALALTHRAIGESAAPEGRKLDLPGQILCVMTLGGLSFAVIEGAHWGWTSPVILAITAASLLAGVAFVVVENRTEGAMAPMALFRSPPFSAALAIAGLMTFGMYALLFLVPLYFQTVRGLSALDAGLWMLALSISFVVVSQLVGRLTNAIGPRVVMAAGMACMGVGEIALAFISEQTGFVMIAIALAVVGVGLGLNTAPVNGVAVASVPQQRSGTASGLVNTARMVGATLGIAILGAVFAHYAGQDAQREAFMPGLRAALLVGGVLELTGAIIAAVFIRADSAQNKYT